MENEVELFPISRLALESVIGRYSYRLNPLPDVHANRFLMAIAGKETSFGANNQPRFEYAYSPNGTYGKKSAALKSLIQQYGRAASCSWGPWQILAITARELGYLGAPKELRDPEISISFVIKFFNHWISEGAESVEELADCWNSGTYRDRNVPQDYILAVKTYYENLPNF